jgi:guanylate kinase
MSEGKVIIFSAPSGAGKTTIVRHLVQHNQCLQFSISATTRGKRPGETDGKDYYFLSKETFLERIARNEFVEYEEVYQGLFYGTLKSEVNRIWENGNHVIADVDVKGGLKLKEIFGKKALAIFIKPPNLLTLEQRLTRRKTESAEKLAERIQKAAYEMGYEKYFDVTIVNDQLEQALVTAQQTLDQFLSAKA